MDETFQQSGQLAMIFISGNFLTGLYYPIGTMPTPTLPTSDLGPVALNGQWYFWDPVTGQYLPQSTSVRPARNYAKNGIYQIQQLGGTFNLSAGVNKTYDMVLSRVTQSGILEISADTGPAASADTDFISSAIKYTVAPGNLTPLAATDIFVHEHLIEGSDIAGIQGETLSLAFSVWVNQPGNYSAYLTSSGRDASYVFPFTITTPNSYARIKINNIPALPLTIGTWHFGEGQTGLYVGVVMAVGAQYQTPTPNQWIAGFFAGTAANSNMVGVLNNQIKITGIKLEASPACSYLTVNSFEQDFHDCIRYYWTSFTYQSVVAGVFLRGSAAFAGQAGFSEVFPRRMCAAPTVVPYGTLAHAAGTITDFTLNADVPLVNLNAVAKGISHQAAFTLVTTGNTHTTVTIDNIPSTTGLAVGMPVLGSGIPANATIATIPNSTSVTISAAATSTLTGTAITFDLAAKGDLLFAYVTADARLS